MKSVRVEGFRGINNEGSPLFVKFKKEMMNSVFAINGIGKSSLYDAIFYAITGKLPKLDKLHPYERTDDYYLNRFHTLSTGTVELEIESDNPAPITHTIQVVRGADGARTVTSPSDHTDPQTLLDALNSSFALLDYHTFNTFINHSPLERGRSFSTLLGLDAYSDFRQTLKTVTETRALRGDLDIPTLEAQAVSLGNNATTAMTRLDTAFNSLTGENIVDTNKLDEYSQKVFELLKQVKLLSDTITATALDAVDFDVIKAAIKKAEGGADRDKYVQTLGQLGKLQQLEFTNQEVINTERGEFTTEINALKTLLDNTAGAMRKRLYAAAEHLITEGGWHDENKCPLCDSDLNSSINSIISDQQLQYAQVDEKLKSIQLKWSSSELKKRATLLEQEIGKDVPPEEKELASFNGKVTEGTVIIANLDTMLAYYDKLESRLTAAIGKYIADKEALQAKLPPSLVQLTEQVEGARQFREHLSDYRKNLALVEKANKKLELRKHWQTFINDAASCFSAAESDLSQNKLNTIESEYKAMFSSVMNASDIVPSLARDAANENLHVKLSDFHGQRDLSAKALLSESFRNALAISVYLSAAMKHNDAPRFIVLDDITSSFDASHQLLLMDYIRQHLQYGTNTSGIQFIILTHDDLMQNLFEHLCSNGEAHHQVIEGMPPHNLTIRGQSAARIRSNASTPLSAGQVEAGQAWVRPYLECMLMEVIRNLKIRVPLEFAVTNKRRMVKSCLDVISDAIKLHIAAGDIVLDATQIACIQNTHVPALIANYVSHFETGSGTPISAPVLLGVLDSVDNFADCFKYDYRDPATGVTSRKYYKSLNRQ